MNNKWDERFMAQARLIATWSKDPSTHCGAVIVDKHKRILATGFNGFARGTDDSPDRYANRDAKLEKVIHAEENAILNSFVSLHGTTIYITGMPCPRCSARIIQVGITTVVLPDPLEDPFTWRGTETAEKFIAGAEEFAPAGVKLRVMDSTHFDSRELMGPLHPYFEGEQNVYFDKFDHFCR